MYGHDICDRLEYFANADLSETPIELGDTVAISFHGRLHVGVVTDYETYTAEDSVYVGIDEGDRTGKYLVKFLPHMCSIDTIEPFFPWEVVKTQFQFGEKSDES